MNTNNDRVPVRVHKPAHSRFVQRRMLRLRLEGILPRKQPPEVHGQTSGLFTLLAYGSGFQVQLARVTPLGRQSLHEKVSYLVTQKGIDPM